MRRMLILAVLVTTLALAGPASADSGNITNIGPAGTGRIQATFTSAWSTCTSYGYCGWFAVAFTVPIGSDCTPNTASVIYVGPIHGTTGSEVVTTSFIAPTNQAFNICLYVSSASQLYLESLNSYWPPAPPVPAPAPAPVPVPAPAPAPAAPAIPQPPSPSAARAVAIQDLQARYGKRWTQGSSQHVTCDGISGPTVTCTMSWRLGKRTRYRGTLSLSATATGITRTWHIRRL